MEKKPMKVKLDKYEREIEKSADSYRPVSKKELRKIEGILDRIRKTKNVNIRISETVLEELKKLSREEGIPYQTLISSVLHKFVTHRLVDEKAIRKSLQLLSSQRQPA
jgi:predicted DNA binding CopG/RHH family protein